MSRTYRKIYPAGSRHNPCKWYQYHFEHRFTEMTRQQQRAHFLGLPRCLRRAQNRFMQPEDYQYPDRHQWEDIHHWVFRNGSCRRQRVHGVRLSKRLENRSQRAVLRHELQRMLVYGYDDIPRYGTGSRHVRLGRVKKTC